MDDRRKQNRSSITDSLRKLLLDTWHVGTSLLSDADLQKSKPEYILSRMLSLKSAVSTDSALAGINQRVQDDQASQTSSCIGAGQCGVVYALKGTTMVIKLPQSLDKFDSLYNDFKCHEMVCKAFLNVSAAYRGHVHVPALKMWVSPESEHFWGTNQALFSEDAQVPDHGLVSERIYPLPLPVRSALVDAFAPEAVRERKHDFLSMQKNKDCLIRLYMGRRNDDAPPVAADRFHLRNFPLHINEMERLKLKASYFAELMAHALAILHWCAGLDANDVEFVFGSSPEVSAMPTSQDLSTVDKDSAATLFKSDFHHRTIGVWLLDFNQCQTFNKDNNGLKQLVDAFYWKDPYYPRPTSTNSKDQLLWKAFSVRYLEVSAEFVDHEMPRAFITSVEEESKKRSANSLFG
ncbi:hypothetical protein N0V86_003790 [Didymella sp. IMI 355093]|nr:hypothetical protein N0V86_003790 [Didymella sp. IMI 355093]